MLQASPGATFTQLSHTLIRSHANEHRGLGGGKDGGITWIGKSRILHVGLDAVREARHLETPPVEVKAPVNTAIARGALA